MLIVYQTVVKLKDRGIHDQHVSIHVLCIVQESPKKKEKHHCYKERRSSKVLSAFMKTFQTQAVLKTNLKEHTKSYVEICVHSQGLTNIKLNSTVELYAVLNVPHLMPHSRLVLS